ARTSCFFGGALAIVSGRSLTDIDTLLAPLRLPSAGEHGAILRLPDNEMESIPTSQSVPHAWRKRLMQVAKDWPSVLVVQQYLSIPDHFRKSPERRADVEMLVRSLVEENTRDFEILPASMAFEIRSRKLNKAEPVHRLMDMKPFHGRKPVFVGDDITDQ